MSMVRTFTVAPQGRDELLPPTAHRQAQCAAFRMVGVASSCVDECAAVVEQGRRAERETTEQRAQIVADVREEVVSRGDDRIGVRSLNTAKRRGARREGRSLPPARRAKAPTGAAGDLTRKCASTTQRLVARMSRVVNDLLDVTSIDAGKVALLIVANLVIVEASLGRWVDTTRASTPLRVDPIP